MASTMEFLHLLYRNIFHPHHSVLIIPSNNEGGGVGGGRAFKDASGSGNKRLPAGEMGCNVECSLLKI